MQKVTEEAFEHLAEEGRLEDGEVYMVIMGADAQFRLVHEGRQFSTVIFPYHTHDIMAGEHSALEVMHRAKTTGWHQPNPQTGEYQCIYCEALALNPRVVSVACPCRHGQRPD